MRDYDRDLRGSDYSGRQGQGWRERQGFGDRDRFRQGQGEGYGHGGGYGGYGGEHGGGETRFGRGGRFEERDEPGMWDRFKGEVREGWESLTGSDEERYGHRGEMGRGMYGRRDYGRDYGRSEYGGGYGGAMSGYRAGMGGIGYGYGGGFGDYGEQRGYGRHGGFRGEREERGMWDRAKDELREGWESAKRSFSGKGPKGYTRSDDRIREDVSDRLMEHPDIDASEIEVMVSSGEVTLSGKVDRRQAKRLAEDIAEDVLGVKDVSNKIRVEREHGRERETFGETGQRTGTNVSNAPQRGSYATR